MTLALTEVDHDVIAAVIGALALVLVAGVPIFAAAVGRRVDKSRDETLEHLNHRLDTLEDDLRSIERELRMQHDREQMRRFGQPPSEGR